MILSLHRPLFEKNRVSAQARVVDAARGARACGDGQDALLHGPIPYSGQSGRSEARHAAALG